MTIQFFGGKKSNHGFMPIVYVVSPSDWREEYESYRHSNKTFAWKVIACSFCTHMRLFKRENTAKAIYRWVEKNHFEPGTVVIADSWYVGYASLAITV
jgi:hypothetical protein